MSENLDKRIHALYRQDFMFAWFDVAFLWAAIGFVLYFVLQIVDNSAIRIALYCSSAVLLIFNTASVKAMTNHYCEDKDYIYGLDIRHMDMNRQIKLAKKNNDKVETYVINHK
ncbi:hypothetical protein LCGC14_0538940 [marine sediment metagenome]|uniref:Uncharacterized protein n=1 Tax=marine sediment metagenome TaxID=412755 RepID=A0A0F9RXZ5_9ZZZZ|nr:hypothetical protein [Methylophaga sp.]HEC59174.1 hypothetical protein [Methylophaga sp.]